MYVYYEVRFIVLTEEKDEDERGVKRGCDGRNSFSFPNIPAKPSTLAAPLIDVCGQSARTGTRSPICSVVVEGTECILNPFRISFYNDR